MCARRAAVDLGASSGRVAVGEIIDSALQFEVVHRFTNEPVETPEGLKWDFDLLLKEIETGLICAGELGDIASVGVDSWAVDYGIVGPDDDLICSPFHYRDRRTEGLMELSINEAGDLIFEETGLQFLPFNTLYQLAAHLRDKPGDFAPENRLLMVPDLVHFKLGGRAAIERTNASTTQFYNPVSGGWSKPLLDRIPTVDSLLPEIVDAGEALGALRSDLKAKPGLASTEIIAPATHDTASAVLAAPMLIPATCAYVSSGTWSLVGVEVQQPVISEAVRELNFSNEVGAGGTIRLLKNVMGLWILQECLRAWGEPDLDNLLNNAGSHLEESAVFDVDDRVFLEPGHDMPDRIRRAIPGLSEEPSQITAAILMSLAAKTAAVLKQAERVSGQKLETVHIVGGGSQNRLLNQLISNAVNLPVVSGPVEATLIGNLLAQFSSKGELSGTIRDTVIRSTQLEVFHPNR